MIKAVNIQDLVPEETLVLLTPMLARQAARDIATSAQVEWISLAESTLKRTARDYVASIQEVRETIVGDMTIYSITLLGALANRVENGWSPYDMRTTLLGPNVPVVTPGDGQSGKKQAKDGSFYRAIPFRVMSEGASGANASRVTDVYAKKLGTKRSAKLGRRVWKIAQKLEASHSDPGTATQWGARLPPGVAGADKLEEHHTTDIFAGIYRMAQKTKGGGLQYSYQSFRTISSNPGREGSWMNKGFDGVHLHKKVMDFIRDTANDTMKTILENSD